MTKENLKKYSVRFEPSIKDKANELGINVSAVCREALLDRIGEEQLKRVRRAAAHSAIWGEDEL